VVVVYIYNFFSTARLYGFKQGGENPDNEKKYHFHSNDAALMADITVVRKDSMHPLEGHAPQIDSPAMQTDDAFMHKIYF